MKKAVFVLVLALVVGLGIVLARRRSAAPAPRPPVAEQMTPKTQKKIEQPAAVVEPKNPDYDREARKKLLGEAKAALLAKIARDYEEMNTDAAAKFSLQGAAYPGGLAAYLKQLALLEKEKWGDYAKVLTPQEFENLQMLEAHAGRLVTQLLGGTAATEDQKWLVFRLQRDFDEKYTAIDVTPAGQLAREIERQAMQERILAALGPDLFVPWSRGEGIDYENLMKFTQANGIRPEAAIEVWRIKNEYARRRLEINVQGGAPADVQAAQAALVEQTRNRVVFLLGPGVLRDANTNGLNWLPAK